MDKTKEEVETSPAGNVNRKYGKTNCKQCRETGSDVTGPVYFLLREQAKSQVAIRDLQEHLKLIESHQEDMVLAIHGIQNHLICFKDKFNDLPSRQKKCVYNEKKLCDNYCNVHDHSIDISRSISNSENTITLKKTSTKWDNLTSTPANNVSLVTIPKTNTINCISKQDGKTKMTVDPVIVDTDNKQDSGLESDCRDQGHDSTYMLTDSVRYIEEASKINDRSLLNSKDELSLLLDVISQRGQYLQQEVAELKKQNSVKEQTFIMDNKQEVKKLHEDNVQLQNQLRSVEQEREKLRIQLSHLETASQDMEGERKRLQERLDSAMCEKQQLEFKIHGLHMQFVKSTDAKQENYITENTQKEIDELQQKKSSKIILNSEENRNRVSSILKENNILELQRQLLTYTVENEVLQTKLEQTLQIYRTKTSQWEKSESMLKSHIKQLMQEKEILQKKLEESRINLATVHTNNKILERALHAMSYHNNEIRKPFLKNFTQNGKTEEAFNISCLQDPGKLLKNSHVYDFGDKTQSLPVIPIDKDGILLNNYSRCSCTNLLPELLNNKLLLNLQNRNNNDKESKQQLINFNENCDTIENVHHRQCHQSAFAHQEKCKNFYFTPISSKELSTVSDSIAGTVEINNHSSLIDSPIENQVWNGTLQQRDPNNTSGSSSISQGLEVSSSGIWDHPTLIDIQSPVKNSRHSYFKDQTNLNSIRSEFDPLSVNNDTLQRTDSQHEIVDSLNLYVGTGQKHLSSTGDSLHSASLEPEISKFAPQIRKFSQPVDVYSGLPTVVGCHQKLPIKRNVQVGQLEKTWPISSSHPNMAAEYDLENNQQFHSILGFMSTTEGETLL